MLRPFSTRGLVATALVLAATSCESQEPAVVLHGANGPVTVQVEVADEPGEQSLGLMYRTEMAEDHGMIFLFGDEIDRSFWMKNTPLSLDMVFIDRLGKIAGIAARTTPMSTKTIGVGKPSRQVLEVNAGFCERHGVRVGDEVEFRHVGADPQP